MRLLLVEDEPSLRESVARKLHRAGYETDDCGDGETALEMLAAERYDLVLLDLNLPLVDGMTVLRTLRKTDLETPVLILSARSEIADKVEGLDAGANDYLAKPFHLAELEARVRSLTRRQFIQRNVCLRCGRLSFDTKSRVAMVDGQPVPLTRKESSVLEYLLLHQGRPVSQEELMEHVWDGRVDAFSNSIRVHISALRKKLRAALGYDPIRNRIGEGYEVGEIIFAMAHHTYDGITNCGCLHLPELVAVSLRRLRYGQSERVRFTISTGRRGGSDHRDPRRSDVRLSGAILARGLRYKDDFWPQRVVHYGSGDAVQRSDCLFYQRQSAGTTERAGTAGREGRSG